MAPVAPSPYHVLGVARSASPNEIRHAYRMLAKRWHPDRRPDHAKATDQLKLINAAYAALRTEPVEEEELLWRATRDREAIWLTSRRLVHEIAGVRLEFPCAEIRRVELRRRRCGASTLHISSPVANHRISVHREYAERLLELLADRIP